ncbi:LlaJI family restriction endonuclease [Gracilibacillus saliphilus]|uniref:LlaJI family restriction endonuclease n=1 Tax=Gracilibacillus saliphilus TaxID=543890 RepID=UPI0013CFF7BE|nr:LlaJI family restriction endonuclease [Gracilibacillus saliphilus]
MIIYFKELASYTESDIIRKMNLSMEKFDQFMRRMRERKIIAQNKDLTYQFKYVGLIEYENRFLMFAPKYFSNIADVSGIKQLLRLFLEYSKRENLDEEQKETLGEAEIESSFNLIPMIDFLLMDYMEHGLYSSENQHEELNGQGEINWIKTIEEQDVYISDGRPYYLEMYTSEIYQDEEDVIRQIHKYVLSEASDYMEQLSLINPYDYPVVDFNIESEDLGSIDYLMYVIEREIQVQFNDQKLRLLNGLYNFLSQEKGINAEDHIHLFGTRTFHVVWEKVCAYVLNNQYKVFKDDIPKPVWTDFFSDEKTVTDTLIPDILSNRPEFNSFFILDAKYYITAFDPDGKLQNNTPGIGDITKQYMYEQALKNSLNLGQDYNWYNLFLLPSEEREDIFGKVTLPFLPDLQSVYLKYVHAPTMFDMYIYHEIYSNNYYEQLKGQLHESEI